MPPTTLLGTLGSAHDVLVDRRGAVQPAGTWLLDWLVGAGDRWHEPATEPGTGVTQRRVEGTPVVETSMRVPGGHVVHRAWGVREGGVELVVVELENRSTAPVAVALVVAGARRVRFDGEQTLWVDGGPGVQLGRVPARAAAGAGLGAVVTAGAAPATAPFDERQPEAAFVFPLAHTARLRAALPVGGGGAVDPGALPDAESVARGWLRHLEAGTRVTLPDEHLASAVVAARTTLLVHPGRRRSAAEAAGVAAALDAWGHHDAAAAAIEALIGQQHLDGSFGAGRDTATSAQVLAAWAAHLRATGDVELAARLAGPAAKAAHRLGRAHRRGPAPAWYAAAQDDAADVLDVAGQPDAAALCRERAARDAAPSAAPTVAPSRGAEEDDDAAGLLLEVRRLLADDRDRSVLALLPAYPDAWLGREVEAHRLPTRAGLLSFAVRWHGPRPALLWELDGARPVLLTARGLDPAWSSDDPVGEALLGPVEPPGGLPAVVAPLGGDATPVDEAPGDGVSFR